VTFIDRWVQAKSSAKVKPGFINSQAVQAEGPAPFSREFLNRAGCNEVGRYGSDPGNPVLIAPLIWPVPRGASLV